MKLHEAKSVSEAIGELGMTKPKVCKHKFEHIVLLGESLDKTDKTKYEWIGHKCIKCKKYEVGGKLESENAK